MYASTGTCGIIGSIFENFNTTANQACCGCGGGSKDGTVTTLFPTPAQTSAAPTTTTVPPSNGPSSPPSIAPTAAKEGKFQKFALRYRVSTSNELEVRNCNWLSKRPINMIQKYCRNKKYQLYTEGFLPASRVCFDTCANYCVQQADNAVFMLGTKLSETGDEVLKLRQCKYLRSLTVKKLAEVCETKVEVDIKTRYGIASEVCTKTCVNSTKAC